MTFKEYILNNISSIKEDFEFDSAINEAVKDFSKYKKPAAAVAGVAVGLGVGVAGNYLQRKALKKKFLEQAERVKKLMAQAKKQGDMQRYYSGQLMLLLLQKKAFQIDGKTYRKRKKETLEKIKALRK